ncbi:MAG: hypothetical protein IT342_09410 [Candidatus Melainabacteria bacterium]|nr:hypothetical protein [Candidatus Melainabacteria bacterium]
MKRKYGELFCIALLTAQAASPALAQATINASASAKESTANVLEIPRQILKTGVSLNTRGIAPNSVQLANTIGLTPIIDRIQALRARVDTTAKAPSMESLSARQDLWDETQKAALLVQKTDLEIDFAIAAIEAEHQVYQEILATFTSDRDKAIARTNAISFITNGALWAVNGSLAIPGYKNAIFAIPSGIVAIPAGVVPSIASMWTLKQINGKKKKSEVEPNMLAKLFGYPTNPDIEYPGSVWAFLNQVPAADPQSKKRLDQLVDRWIADSNMPGFTDRKSKRQLDVITGSVAQRKGLSISSLTSRSVMLQQLHAEISKMKRMLLELTMVIQGEKTLTASQPLNGPRIGMEMPGVP